MLGLSSVVLIFDDGTDRMRRASSCRSGCRGSPRRCPRGPAAGDPLAAVVAQPRDEDRRLVEELSQIELTTLAKWTIRPRLMAIPGVANVAIWGQRDRQLQVLVDPERLRANNVIA